MFLPAGVKICTKIFVEEIQGGEGCRKKSTSNFITPFHTLSSETQIQGNYCFKEEVADETSALVWRTDQETHVPRGKQRREQAAGCISLVRGISILQSNAKDNS